MVGRRLLWLVALAGCGPQPTWPHFHHDVFLSGRSQFSTVANTGFEKWRFPTGGAIDSSPAVADDGTIYVGSNDGNLYAVKPDGNLKWKLPIPGGAVTSSPAILPDGTVCVGSRNGNVFGVKPGGSFSWAFTASGGPIESSPITTGAGRVYIGSNNGNVYALNATGGLIWKSPVSPGVPVRTTPAFGFDNSIYVQPNDTTLYALKSSNGTLKWTFNHLSGVGNTSPAVGNGGVIYFGSQDKNIYAVKPDGTPSWAFPTGGIVGSSPAIADDGTIYVVSGDHHVYALRPTGSVKWTSPLGSSFRSTSSPAIGADGTVYIGSVDRNVYALNATDGTRKWTFLTGGPIHSSPAIGADGTIYIGSGDHFLYAIGAGPSPTGTPAPTVTPTPGPLCGNGMVDPGEGCDPPGSPCPNAAPGALCGGACQCACPGRLELTGAAVGPVVDRGWTGQVHDVSLVSGGTVSVGIMSCAGPSRPCGVCTFSGPIANRDAANYASASGTQLNNHRCTGNTRITCNVNADCAAAGGTCEFYVTSFVPVSVGGVAGCVEQRFSGTLTGTVNIEAGSIANTVAIVERLFAGRTNTVPCPRCKGDALPNDGVRGGTCDAGADAGSSCDIDGASPNELYGDTSLDCRPNTSILATVAYGRPTATGTTTRSLTADSPSCRAVGHTGAKCMCDTCDNAAATPCSTNADCAAVGATVCGGRRCLTGSNFGARCSVASECPGGGACGTPGVATAPNACNGGDLDCVPGGTPGANDGVCQSGPVDFFCQPNGTMFSCISDADCAAAGLRSCVGGARAGHVCSASTDCPGGTCDFERCTGAKTHECFLDGGQIGGHDDATGQASVPVNDASDPILAGMSCIGPTSGAAINATVGVPGLQRFEQPTHVQGRP